MTDDQGSKKDKMGFDANNFMFCRVIRASCTRTSGMQAYACLQLN